MADPKYMRKIQGMCRCQDCGLMADNADIDVELDCDEIVFEWSDADDSQTCNLPPCYGGHRLQTDMTAYDLLLELGVIDDRIDMLPRPSALSRAGQSSKNGQSGQFRSLSLLQFS